MTPLVDWGELPFGGDPMLGESVAEMMEGTARSAKRKARKNRGRRPTETDKLQRPPGLLDFDTKLWVGLLSTVRESTRPEGRPCLPRPGDEGARKGANWICKSCWRRRASNFIGQGTSTWDRGRI